MTTLTSMSSLPSMPAVEKFIIDEETVQKIGLRATQKISPPGAPNARIFEYPHLENVFVMESDLYGNPMPKDYCFLAFYGNHGLIGTELDVAALKNSSIDDIKDLVQRNSHG